jgi:hypothetical protein
MGLPVIFTESLPVCSCEGDLIDSMLPHFMVEKTEQLPSMLQDMGLCQLSGNGKGLDAIRFYHIERDNTQIYLFSNEAVNSTFDGEIIIKNATECLIYEPWDNKLYKAKLNDNKLRLRIENGNTLFVITGCDIPDNTPYFKYEMERKSLPLLFDISVMDEGEREYRLIAKNSECFDISAPNRLPYFSGSILYESTFKADTDFTVLDLGQVGEIAEVYLNDKYIGLRINAPYKFDLKDALVNGENKLKIIVKSNLAHRRRDDLSRFIQIPPSGILGDISLCRYEK